MPNVNIYVTDTMKARMDAVSDRANWSAIAQRAFDIELQRIEKMKEQNMYTSEGAKMHLLCEIEGASFFRQERAEMYPQDARNAKTVAALATIEPLVEGIPSDDPAFAQLAEAWQFALPGGAFSEDGTHIQVTYMTDAEVEAFCDRAAEVQQSFYNAVGRYYGFDGGEIDGQAFIENMIAALS